MRLVCSKPRSVSNFPYFSLSLSTERRATLTIRIMTKFSAVLIAIIIFATFAHSAIGQTSQTSNQVFVRLRWEYHVCDADFDTDGQTIGNLSEIELNKKFTKIKSAASVMNFMSQNGYKVVGFSSTCASSRRGDGGGFNGYAILFEKAK